MLLTWGSSAWNRPGPNLTEPLSPFWSRMSCLILREAAWTSAPPQLCTPLPAPSVPVSHSLWGPGPGPGPVQSTQLFTSLTSLCRLLWEEAAAAPSAGRARHVCFAPGGRPERSKRHPHADRVFPPCLYFPSVLISWRPVVAREEPTPPGSAGRLRCGWLKRRFHRRLPRKWGSTRRPEWPSAGKAGEPSRAKDRERAA